MSRTKWTDADFAEMSWHDCNINSLTFEQDGEWQSDLVFNLDFIVEWLCQVESGSCRFRIAPATLRFHDVGNLRMRAQLGFKEPLTIFDIERTPQANQNQGGWHWILKLQSYGGTEDNIIEFDAARFSQELSAEPVETSEQNLLEFRRQQSQSKDGREQL